MDAPYKDEIRNYLKECIKRYRGNGNKAPETLSPEELQVAIEDAFNSFWSRAINREGNEDNGYYSKYMYFLPNKFVEIKVHRDKLNKFHSPYTVKFFKYSEDVVYFILTLMATSHPSASYICKVLEHQNIKCNFGLIYLIYKLWDEAELLDKRKVRQD